MNRRYLDPLFFAFLFALDVIAWIVTWMLNATPTIIAIMAPVFLSMTVLALLRSALDLEPRRFWSGLTAVTLIFAIFMGLTELLTPNLQSVNLEFSVSIAFMVIAVVCSLIALFLALVKAIPDPAAKTPRTPKAPKTPKTPPTDTALPLPSKEPHAE